MKAVCPFFQAPLTVSCDSRARRERLIDRLAQIRKAHEKLVPGVSTMADARNILGAPASFSSLPGGGTLLQWIEISSSHAIHLCVTFDAQGRMIEITHAYAK